MQNGEATTGANRAQKTMLMLWPRRPRISLTGLSGLLWESTGKAYGPVRENLRPPSEYRSKRTCAAAGKEQPTPPQDLAAETIEKAGGEGAAHRRTKASRVQGASVQIRCSELIQVSSSRTSRTRPMAGRNRHSCIAMLSPCAPQGARRMQVG